LEARITVESGNTGRRQHDASSAIHLKKLDRKRWLSMPSRPDPSCQERRPGDIIVAGKTGLRSSREQAVICLKEVGSADRASPSPASTPQLHQRRPADRNLRCRGRRREWRRGHRRLCRGQGFHPRGEYAFHRWTVGAGDPPDWSWCLRQAKTGSNR